MVTIISSGRRHLFVNDAHIRNQLTTLANFDWPTRVTRVNLTWCQVYGNLHGVRSTTKVIQLNSDDRDHGNKLFMYIN